MVPDSSSDESKFAENDGCVWGGSGFDGPATGAGSSISSGSASSGFLGLYASPRNGSFGTNWLFLTALQWAVLVSK